MWLLDRLSMLVAMTGGFIRIGNLMNSEILGRTTDVPWAFIFTRVDQRPRHPVQIYESLTYFSLFAVLWLIYRRNPKSPPGLLFGLTLIVMFIGRIVWEFFKENQEAFDMGLPLNMGQLLSIPFLLVGIYLVVRAVRLPPVPEEPTKGPQKWSYRKSRK
jgi:prolipoprotein diacylglyceryltransferase